MTAVFVGLDLGTQSVRALAVSATGELLGRGSHPLTSRRHGVRHEQDPEAWWTALTAATREALSDIPPGRVRGVATCGTSGTIVLVASDGQAVGPALMYDDARATEQARRLDMASSWALPKLAWLIDQRADGVRLAHQPDVVTRRLVGHDVPTDSSHALKTGYDLVADEWPPALRTEYGGLLPDVVRAGSQLGVVCPQAAAQTELPAGTPVIAGMTDGCAAQIAAGALREGAWNSVLGTTLVLKGVSAQPIHDPHGIVYCHRSPDGQWLPGGASSSGAGILSTTFPGRELDQLTHLAAGHEQTSVLAYPLVGRGERFPFVAPDAEAFLVGQPADEGEHFAALLQGLAFVERLCFEYLRLLGAPTDGELSLTGAATRNSHLNQLRADVLERPVRLVDNAESAYGMAILAMAAVEGERVADTAARMSRTREVIEPRGERAEHLRERYGHFVGELERRGWLVRRAR
ncbi:MAG: D-ribulokinase [Solirubrobacteraceae bacterium]|nr:D-ribulokinase [Solirubrobacteraceae bacterium]